MSAVDPRAHDSQPPDDAVTSSELGWVGGVPEWLPAACSLGRVVRIDRGELTIAGLPGMARVTDAGAGRRVAVGDWVGVAERCDRVERVGPRHSALVRRAARGARRGQILATNVDVVVIVHGFRPGISMRRLERELVVAWASGARPVVICNKVDLAGDDEVADTEREVRRHAPDAPVVCCSASTGEGIEELRALLRGRTSVLLGSSGVGKSTLTNLLVGADVQVTGEVRDFDAKGRQTTTFTRLLPLPGGGVIIDSPGTRSLGLWQAETGLAHTFPEIVNAAADCAFSNCAHRSEPNCAVLHALSDGAIDPARFAHWQELTVEAPGPPAR